LNENQKELLTIISDSVKLKHQNWREIDQTVLTAFATGKNEYKTTRVFKVVRISVTMKYKKFSSFEYLASLTNDPTFMLLNNDSDVNKILNQLTVNDDDYVVSF